MCYRVAIGTDFGCSKFEQDGAPTEELFHGLTALDFHRAGSAIGEPEA